MSNKRRNKKYTGKMASKDKPTVHKYVAEEEEQKDRRKQWLRYGAIALVIGGVLLLIFLLVL